MREILLGSAAMATLHHAERTAAVPTRGETTPIGYGIERVSDADLAFLAMDRGPVPEQLAVVLVLDGRLTVAACTPLLERWAAEAPRLRQRLVRTPPGCGQPIWVDTRVDPSRHLATATCPAPGGDPELLTTLLPHVLRRLPRDRPLWRAVLIDGLAGGRTALALVAHHVLSDGLGGLAVLGRLLDGAVPAERVPAEGMPAEGVPAAARPPAWRLAGDAWRQRVTAVRELPDRWRRLRTAMAAGGGVAPAAVPSCSLLHVTGAHRRAILVRAPLARLRDVAHRHGVTVNTVLVVAVAEALRGLLDGRGETVSAITVALPVGTPRPGGGLAGNAVSPLVVTVPATGPRSRRWGEVSDAVRGRRPGAAGAAPITVLGGLFRLLAALGGFGWYMSHQRRLHTLVSNVRGPQLPVRLGGLPVRDMIPIVVGGTTNVTVMFVALSYAGSLTVTVVADPEHCPDLDRLGRLLAAELDMAGGTAPADPS